jgi:hypothetical protein
MGNECETLVRKRRDAPRRPAVQILARRRPPNVRLLAARLPPAPQLPIPADPPSSAAAGAAILINPAKFPAPEAYPLGPGPAREPGEPDRSEGAPDYSLSRLPPGLRLSQPPRDTVQPTTVHG